jgi:MFS family permease
MASLNLVSSTGLLAGPVVAGLLGELDLRWPLWVAAAGAAVAAVAAARLPGHPPYRPPQRPADQPLRRHPAVVAAGWTGTTAGAWRGLLGSYVPVVLERAGQSSATIGALVAAANAASIAGSVLAGRLRVGTTRALGWCTVATGLGLATAALTAEAALACGAALLVSGVGAGGLQTFGPALAADGVDPEERGLAIASTGTYRAVALFVAPMAVAGLVLALPVTTALALAGVVATGPALLARRSREAS